MYAAKFTVLYVIAALAVFASASPVPAAKVRAVRAADIDLVVREPLPEAEATDVERRICRRYNNCL